MGSLEAVRVASDCQSPRIPEKPARTARKGTTVGSMSTSRLALVFSVMLISAVGCRSMASTRIAVGSTSPVVSSGVGVGIVEGPSPGTFVVIDGMATDGETTMSRIVQLSRDGSVVLKTLNYGVVAPMSCERQGPGDNHQ